MDQQRSMRCHRRGFTLLEVLLVMAITSVLILGMNAAYRQAHRLWLQVEGQRDVYDRARVLTDVLRTELGGLYLPPAQEEQGAQGENSPFSLQSTTDGAVELAFCTLTPAWHGDVASSRMARVRYRFTRGQDTGQPLLERFEQPCAGEKIIGQETCTTLTLGLASFALWAVDPNASRADEQLRPVYESKDRPPKALKAVLGWPETEDVPASVFETLIMIPCEGQLQAGSSNQE